jgi:hypothetical protein
MAASQATRKSTPIPYDAYGDMERDGGDAGTADTFEPDRTLTQFSFATPADPRAEYRRAISVLTAVAIAIAGAIAGIAYFAGLVAAGIVAAAVTALVGLGNWILNHTIDLR